MAHNSILEASKANDEIGEIGLDGAVGGEAVDDKSNISRSKNSKQETIGGEKTPSKLENASKQESKENLLGVPGQVDWTKVGRIYKPESAIEDILAKEMGRLGKAFDMAIDA